MVLRTTVPPVEPPAVAEPAVPGNRRRPGDSAVYLLLAAGLVLQLLAVGGRWDLSVAAWLYPVFLMRFARVSRRRYGLPLVILVSVLGALFWFIQLAVPLTPITFVGVIGLGTMVGLPFLLDRLLFARLALPLRLLLFPAAVTAVEYALGVFGPFGTAYGLLAVTQRGNLPLLQVTALAGPYVIGFLIGLVATTANHVWENGFAWRRVRVAGVVAAVLATVLLAGQARLAWFPAPSAPTVRIAGINPTAESLRTAEELLGTPPTDLPALSAMEPETVRAAADVVSSQLFEDTRTAASAGARIVVWSENAARILDADLPEFLEEAGSVAERNGIYLDVAVNVVLPEAPFGRDATMLLGPDGRVLWTYDKRRPIPGLESYTPGEGEIPVVQTPYGRLSNVICYDADFPALMNVDTDIMLVPGGDWPEMGRTHTQMAGLRAIENGYALVRQDLNGSSQAFDRQGQVLSQQDTTPGDNLPWVVDVPTSGSATPYRVVGDVFAWAGLALLAGAVIAAMRSRRGELTTTRTAG